MKDSITTIFVLLYGDYPKLHRTMLESLLTQPQGELDIRLWLNAVCLETIDWLITYSPASWLIYISDHNIPKYQAMRRLFNDPAHLITTEWITWFDDDMPIAKKDWLSRTTEFADFAAGSGDIALFGRLDRSGYRLGMVPWLKEASWYTGRPLQHVEIADKYKGPGTIFAAGAYWWLRTNVMQMIDWPDRRLKHNGGDNMLAAALWQAGLKQRSYWYGIAWKRTPRRGLTESVNIKTDARIPTMLNAMDKYLQYLKGRNSKFAVRDDHLCMLGERAVNDTGVPVILINDINDITWHRPTPSTLVKQFATEKYKLLKRLYETRAQRSKKSLKSQSNEFSGTQVALQPAPFAEKATTVFMLLYGDYPEWHKKVLPPLLKQPQEKLDVRLWLNVVCLDTLKWLKINAPKDWLIYLSDRNIPKYRVMRQLFHDTVYPITTEWLTWFDDDTPIIADDWLEKTLEFIANTRNVAFFGRVSPKGHNAGVKKWIETADWYTGRPLQRINVDNYHGPGICFVQGCYWWLRADVMRMLDWPDKRLNHNGGDTALSEAIWQARLTQCNFWYGVDRGEAPRRGLTEPPAGFKFKRATKSDGRVAVMLDRMADYEQYLVAENVEFVIRNDHLYMLGDRAELASKPVITADTAAVPVTPAAPTNSQVVTIRRPIATRAVLLERLRRKREIKRDQFRA